ncbi:MAG: Crp/Fnr family transcriptional regulator, partial [Archangium sp.]|nr:Crp/Fnr family transcriptional regulator [Archangium sp.]
MFASPIESCDLCALGKNGPCLFRPRAFKAGAGLLHQGEVNRSVHFVKDGVVGLTATDATGEEVLSSVRGPNTVLGLESLQERPAPFTVTALEDTTVCSASALQVRRETDLDATSSLTSSFLGLVLAEHANTQRDADLRAGQARARVAKFLVAAARLVKPGRKAAFSKAHVAALLGIRPETLSRCLRKLSEEGL